MVLLRVIVSSNCFLPFSRTVRISVIYFLKKYPIAIQSRQLARIRSSTGRIGPPHDPTTPAQCEQNLDEPSFISSKLDQTATTTSSSKDSTRKYTSAIAIVKEVWRQYKWTWQGFFQSNLPSHHFIYKTKEQEEKELEEQKEKEEQEEQLQKKNENKEAKKTPSSPENEESTTMFNPDDIRDNLNRNINDIRTQGPKLAEKMTGMNKEEFSKFIGDQMRLATDCIAHLMQGYRQGRDQEIDNMLHKYFQEEEQPKQQSTTNGLDDASPPPEQSNPSSISGRRRRRMNHLRSKVT